MWLPAFVDGGMSWKVRHTPTMIGLYQVSSITLNGQPIAVSNQQPSSWTVTGPVISSGYVQVNPIKASRFIASNGGRYFPLGHNVAWDTRTTTNVVSTLARLGARIGRGFGWIIGMARTWTGRSPELLGN